MEDTEDLISVGDLAGHELGLHHMSGNEMLGGMFKYRLEVASKEPDIEPKDVLGEKLSVKIRLPEGGERFFNGHVTSWSYGGRLHDRTIYELTLHPWLWLLGFTSDCRVFNGRSALDIVKRVFSRYGQADFNASPLVASDYPPYEHCVQYRETDLNFVLRLLQHEGIYFFFKHETDRHVLTLADGLGAHATRPGYEEIPYMPPTTNARDMSPHFNLCTFRQGVQTRSYWHQDFDFKNPRGSLLAFCPSNQQQERYRTGEIFEYPGQYVDHARGQALARTRLDERHQPAQVIKASGNPLGLSTGDLFTLPNPPWCRQPVKFLVTGAHYELRVAHEHSGGPDNSQAPYAARYTLIPQDEPFRPARTAPRPIIPGPQTAIVVGHQKNADQEPEEIVTDEYGRVRVRFHWERVGHNYPESRGLKDDNEDSDTCWIRVAQKWAGSRWGSIHIPRVGHEVVVEFLEGDPDRPLITGSVYNDANKPPYELDKNKTQSGIKSRSTKGGNPDNFNEIRFEDLKGKEELHIQAERDMSTNVKRNESLSVGGDRSVSVTGNQSVSISGKGKSPVHSTVSVTGKHTLDATDTIYIKAPTSITLECPGSKIEMLPGKITITAGGGAQIVLDANALTKSNAGAKTVHDANVLHQSVPGANILLDANVAAQAVGGAKVLLDANVLAQSSGGSKLQLDGDASMEGAAKATVKGATEGTLTAGAGTVKTGPAGVDATGPKIGINGSATVTIAGAMVKIN